MDGCEADEQMKKSRALDLARGVQECSTFNRSARKMSGTVHSGADTGTIHPGGITIVK